jgi:hypothetical protein
MGGQIHMIDYVGTKQGETNPLEFSLSSRSRARHSDRVAGVFRACEPGDRAQQYAPGNGPCVLKF